MQVFIKKQANKLSLSMRKPVFGVGVNDSWYMTVQKVNDKLVTCPVYAKWKNMITRCYDPKHQEKYPTYKGCEACKEWLTFSNFAGWFNENYIEGYALDKDIIKKGNKVYSPDSCLFIPSCINNLLLDSGASRGECPTGTSLNKNTGKYKAYLSIDSARKHIGFFKTPEEAHEAYIKAKNSEIMRKCEQYPDLSRYLINHLL